MIPEDAISVETAAQMILDAVERKEGIAVIPKSTEELYHRVRSDPAFEEESMLDLARERRHNYETKGTYF